jgi:hypothetical protein
VAPEHAITGPQTRDWTIKAPAPKHTTGGPQQSEYSDVRIIGTEISVLADGEVIATHQEGVRRNSYVTDPAHAPARYEAMQGLWTRAYFLRQAGKVGPGCVAALTRLLDGKVIEAQGFRSCMNILDLGKRGDRHLLEQACQQVCEEDPYRQVSYTAIKHRLTVLRADQDERPTTGGSRPALSDPAGDTASSSIARDTSRAYLAGAEAFSLDALTQQAQPAHAERAEGADRA